MTMVGVGPAGTCGDLVTYRRERLHASGWCQHIVTMFSLQIGLPSPSDDVTGDVSGGHVAGRRAGLLKDIEPAPSATALVRP